MRLSKIIKALEDYDGWIRLRDEEWNDWRHANTNRDIIPDFLYVNDVKLAIRLKYNYKLGEESLHYRELIKRYVEVVDKIKKAKIEYYTNNPSKYVLLSNLERLKPMDVYSISALVSYATVPVLNIPMVGTYGLRDYRSPGDLAWAFARPTLNYPNPLLFSLIFAEEIDSFDWMVSENCPFPEKDYRGVKFIYRMCKFFRSLFS